MGNGRSCYCEINCKSSIIIIQKIEKNIQTEYIMIDLLIGLQPNNKLHELNALLQCLCHIEPLVNYFKYKFEDIKTINNYKRCKDDGLCLTDYFKNIVDELWPDIDIKNKSQIITHNNTESSKEFLDMIYTINPNYNENGEYLIKFLQKRLHEELNMVENENNNNTDNINLSNKKKSFDNYLINFEKNNKSKISDIFYGTFYSYSQFFCGHQEYNFQSYTFGFYSLQQVLQYKLLTCQNGQNPLYINGNANMNEINIYDCLLYDNQMRSSYKLCKICDVERECNNQNIIYLAPKILCFVFNKNENVPMVNFNIENNININQFSENKDMIIYELIGIIAYFYPNHYIACCKNPVNMLWYSYDNDKVEKMFSIEEILNKRLIPYMLFYQHKKIIQN